MSRRRPIGVVTTTRADYGLLRPVLERLERSETLEPRLIVSGTHLSERHGATVAEIEADGRAIAARIPLPLAGDDGAAKARDMAAMLAGASEAYRDLDLEAVMVLGDRTEVLAAAAAALPLALPTLHLEGGHRTAGAVDDAARHAISKMAALHFTAAEPYRRRLLQMGEAPERVFATGSTAVDNLKAFGRATRAEVSRALGVDLEPGFLLITFHPETLSALSPGEQAGLFLAGVGEALKARPELKAVITQPNADAGGEAVRAAIAAFARARADRVHLFESLGAGGYLGAMTACEAVVGNSSSGVIEAPAAGVPSVDVGGRQAGRIKPPSVVETVLEPSAVTEAIGRALVPGFREAARNQPPPFGDGRAAERIVAVLERTDFGGLARKPFVDL